MQPVPRPRVFDPFYMEEFALRDGRRARLQALRPEHAELVRAGFAKLSARSRYLRFFGPKRALTDADMEQLLAIDERAHYALAVVIDGPSGPEGIAVGRLVCADGAPDHAELAITVLDAYQRHGLGRLLLDRLQCAAAERGYTHAHGEVLAENRPMLALLRKTIPELHTQLDGTVVTVDWPLAAAARPCAQTRSAA